MLVIKHIVCFSIMIWNTTKNNNNDLEQLFVALHTYYNYYFLTNTYYNKDSAKTQLTLNY